MRISDWSSDVCSSDLHVAHAACELQIGRIAVSGHGGLQQVHKLRRIGMRFAPRALAVEAADGQIDDGTVKGGVVTQLCIEVQRGIRSEEHTSELQSLMRISYAVFCLKKKKKKHYKVKQ